MSEGDESLLRELVAGIAKAEQRGEEMFRRLGKVEVVAGEALAASREVVTVLREQDALAKIAQTKAEIRLDVNALRQDLVLAVANVRAANDNLAERVASLEALRQTGTGMAKGAKIAWELAKLFVAAGGGAILIKFLELAHH